MTKVELTQGPPFISPRLSGIKTSLRRAPTRVGPGGGWGPRPRTAVRIPSAPALRCQPAERGASAPQTSHPGGIPGWNGHRAQPRASALPGRITASATNWRRRGRGCSFVAQSAENSRSRVRRGNWIYFHPTSNRFSRASERLFYKANSNQAVH